MLLVLNVFKLKIEPGLAVCEYSEAIFLQKGHAIMKYNFSQ